MNAPSDGIVAAARRWYHFCYFLQTREGRQLPLHQPRDTLGALCLSGALSARGYEFAGTIFNHPLAEPPVCEIAVDTPRLRPGDLLVVTTRPALDDASEGNRRRLYRSHTTLEGLVYAAARRSLKYCARSRVEVADRHARAWPEVCRMANVLFHQNRGAAVDAYLPFGAARWERPRAGLRVSVTYLIYEEHAWENGPALLASFGMSGADTLAWNHVLATSFPHLIASVPFLMAEIIATPRRRPPQDLAEFTGSMTVRLLTTAVAPAHT